MKNKHEQIFDIVTDGTLNIGQIVNKLADREAVTERICNRRIGRSCLIMGIVFLALGFSGLWVRFHEHATPAQSLPDRPGIVLDTSLIDHSEIPDDTSYKSYRQGSPEGDRRYDSAARVDDPKIAVVQECHLTTFGYWALCTTGWNHGKVIYDGWIKGPTRAACERHRKEEYNKGNAAGRTATAIGCTNARTGPSMTSMWFISSYATG